MKCLITKHAHNQYCSRVGPIDFDELTIICQFQFDTRDFKFRKPNFIHLGGVWWIYDLDEHQEVIFFITCYGKTDMDLPQALKWAGHMNDRIDLENLI